MPAGRQGGFHGDERVLDFVHPIGANDAAAVFIEGCAARTVAGVVYQDACFHDNCPAEAIKISDIKCSEPSLPSPIRYREQLSVLLSPSLLHFLAIKLIFYVNRITLYSPVKRTLWPSGFKKRCCMRSILVLAFSLLFISPAAHAENLMVVKQSPHSVSKTLDRLTAVMQKKGLTIFARVDHAAGAKKAGLDMKPTELLIFGNPKMGTPLMLAKRTIGVDLPLKALAWQDDAGKVWLGYTTPAALKARHGVAGRDEIFKKMTGALDKLTNVAIKAE
jgi:uncharacterized protein (DUF302 family)